MKAALLFGREDLRVEDVETPAPKSNEVKVKVKACGICHYDLRFYTGSKKTEKPVILGHECSGTIEQVGADVFELKVGDRVAVSTDIPCGHCRYCMSGRSNFCTNRKTTDGGFAEYKVIPVGQVFRFSESTSFQEACLTEPLACCLNGNLRAGIHSDSCVAVVGVGPIGLLHVQLARLFGAYKAIAIDPITARREKALELGAHEVVDPAATDPVRELMRLTDGFGADAVIVAVENIGAVEQGIKMVGKRGIIVVFAGFHPPKDVTVDTNLLHYSEISITGSSDFPAPLFPRALTLIDSHRIQTKPIISHSFSLEQINEGFKTALIGKALKTIITP